MHVKKNSKPNLTWHNIINLNMDQRNRDRKADRSHMPLAPEFSIYEPNRLFCLYSFFFLVSLKLNAKILVLLHEHSRALECIEVHALDTVVPMGQLVTSFE